MGSFGAAPKGPMGSSKRIARTTRIFARVALATVAGCTSSGGGESGDGGVTARDVSVGDEGTDVPASADDRSLGDVSDAATNDVSVLDQMASDILAPADDVPSDTEA